MEFIDLKAQQAIIKESLDQRLQKVLAHGCYILGPEVFELEKALADYVGVKHCISCASGTDALLMALLALDIGAGDEVITTPYTFIATVEMIALIGAKPVFVDIDPQTFNIDATRIESAISNKTKAIIPVGLFGQCADITKINAIAQKHEIPVIEDAAQNFGAQHDGKLACGLTTIATTSFFPAKPLGCYGDGGACFTNNDALAEKLCWLRVHGQRVRDDVQLIGIGGRLDTLQAAILLEKFAIFPDELEKRQVIAAAYHVALKHLLETPFIAPGNTSTYAMYACLSVQRDVIQQALKDQGIPTGIYYSKPAHLQPAYAYLGYKPGDFPNAERTAKQIICLPMHPYLADQDIKKIAQAIQAVL